MNNNWEIKIVDVGYKLERDIYIFRERPDRKIEMLDGTIIDIGIAAPTPTISLCPEELQKLSDALNNIGIKPQKGYLEGKLEATERHLNDIRQVAKLK